MTDPSRTIAFQGAPGAYSHLACLAVRPELSPLPCETFDDVFDAVEQGRALLAAIPVENSQAGRVVDNHRLLPARSLHVIGEHYQPIHHQLLAVPGATVEDIRAVRSHPQALAQCRRYLRTRGWEPVVWSDTSGAARDVARLGDPSVAAIASAIAGDLWGLVTLDRDVEDDPNNTTRFLVLSRTAELPGAASGPAITSVVFRVRNLPAALYKALGGFATNGINLLKIESYQVGGAFRWTQFAVDFEGHPADPPVANAMEELRFFSTELRVLGTYPAHPWRRGLT
jgi:prephenate dehydratase